MKNINKIIILTFLCIIFNVSYLNVKAMNQTKELVINPGESYECSTKVGWANVDFEGENGTEGIHVGINSDFFSRTVVEQTFTARLLDNNSIIIKNSSNTPKKFYFSYDGEIIIERTTKEPYEKITLKKGQTLDYKILDMRFFNISPKYADGKERDYDVIANYEFRKNGADNGGNDFIIINRYGNTILTHRVDMYMNNFEKINRARITNTSEVELNVYINHATKYDYTIINEECLQEISLFKGESIKYNGKSVVDFKNNDNKKELLIDVEYNGYCAIDFNGDRVVRLFNNKRISNVSENGYKLLVPKDIKDDFEKQNTPIFSRKYLRVGEVFEINNSTNKSYDIIGGTYNDTGEGNTVLCTVHSGEKATLIGEDKVVYIPIELIFDDRELKDEDLNRDGE
ncbi:MAG: hypothetical protein ACRC7N_14375, partial [Clostridium sp.]